LPHLTNYNVMTGPKPYSLDKRLTDFPAEADAAFKDFWDSIETIEKQHNLKPIIFQDQKSGSYYIECHGNASIFESLLDIDAVLDPEEQAEYRANRSLQEEHRAFVQMIDDAKKGRQFSDLIVEYNKEYKTEMPLKVLGGQHRVEAVREALQEGIDRPHGFKVYFALTREQRNEIAQISNTNIALPVDLLDRMQETMLRSGLRKWCQEIGLLGDDEDFADRKTTEGPVAVKAARSFVVSFHEGKAKGYDPDALYVPHLCRSSIGGLVDDKYVLLLKTKGNKIWQDPDLLNAGKAFAELHNAQFNAVEKDSKLKQFPEFKTKTITPVVAAAFGMIAGAVIKEKAKQKKLFELGKVKGRDPLNANALSNAKHHSDLPTYRGIGARSDKKELGRMAEVVMLPV